MDLGIALQHNPMYVTYSMERIACRGGYLDHVGRSRQALTAWLSWNEKDFATKMAATSVEEWLAFKEKWPQSREAKKWLMAS